MESDEGQSIDQYHSLGTQEDQLRREEGEQSHGGKRRGAGRKRMHESSYKEVKFALWKNVSLHTEVYNEWLEMKHCLGFKDNSSFARFLLDTKSRSSQIRRVESPNVSMVISDDFAVDFFPQAVSTPRNHINIRTQLFQSPGCNESVHNASTNRNRSNVFVETVIRNTSLACISCENDSDDESDDESDDDGNEALVTTSDSDSSNCSDDDLQDEFKGLEISFDQDFLDHDSENIDEHNTTSTECTEMDVSSSLEPQTIECNLPVIDGIPQTPLLAEGYETKLSIGLETELCHVNGMKFICSSTKVMELFNSCLNKYCTSSTTEVKERFIGCTMEIQWKCETGHSGVWRSSEVVNNMCVNNLQASASLLYTGNNFTKMSLFAKCYQLAFISSTTFLRHQKNYLVPTVHDWWDNTLDMMCESLGSKPVVVTGDGQMDSPGFSAKNCTYTLMHATLNYILGVEVVDVRHSQLKSTVMEKVGCERALDELMGKLKIVEFVTDASSQIIKLLATSAKYKSIVHQLDIWHKSTKLDKKLNEVLGADLEAGKMKGNEILQKWVAPVRNHFWHCAKDCKGDLKKMKVMWINLLKHATDQHEWYNGKCSHGPLEQKEREWLQRDSAPMQALREIVMNKKLLKTFPFYTRFRHTGKLESYHSHRLMYAPKRFGFSYEGTFVRSLLAVIDHNHHLNRKQAKNAKGELVFSRRWSKRGKRWKVVMVKEKKNYAYFPILCAKALQALGKGKPRPLTYVNDPKNIAPTIAKLPAPPTSQLVQEHRSRF